MQEDDIKNKIAAKFPDLAERVTVKRERRILIDVPSYGTFSGLFDYMLNDLKISSLCTITGLDEGATFGVIYHLAYAGKIVVNLKVHVPRENPRIKTITNYFPAADAYERELMDLFGIAVEGLPEGHRYPLPETWPVGDYPLRKDWKGVLPADKMDKEADNNA